jgi:aldehyde:ferredoxin oxidoreductase
MPEKIDRLTFKDKPMLVKKSQDLAAVIDSLVVCKSSNFAITEKEYSRLMSAATGITYTPEELLKAGEMI